MASVSSSCISDGQAECPGGGVEIIISAERCMCLRKLGVKMRGNDIYACIRQLLRVEASKNSSPFS